MRVAVLCAAILLLPLPAFSRHYLILPDGSGAYATIQAAFNDSLAATGDTLLLGDGTFRGPGNRDIDPGGKNLVIQSASGNRDACIIDCEGSQTAPHRAFNYHNNESPHSRIMDFTITNGYVINGGGGAVRCTNNANPSIQNIAFCGNTSLSGSGSGVGGAIVHIGPSPFLIELCRFQNNVALSRGGAIYAKCDIGVGHISSCDFEQNTCGPSGTTVFIDGRGDAVVENCTFEENAGGVDCEASWDDVHTSIVGCTFYSNGWALAFYRRFSVVERCTFVGQTGPITCYLVGHATAFEECTWVDNAGTAISLAGILGLDRCLIVRDPALHVETTGSSVSCACTDIWGNATNWDGWLAGFLGQDGNIEEDPEFCEPPGESLYVNADSPCASGSPANPAGCGQIGAWPAGCGGPSGLSLAGVALGDSLASPGDSLDAIFRISLGPCPVDSLLTLDVRLWSPRGSFEAAPFDTQVLVTCGTREYARPAYLPDDLDPGWYSCNWVLNDGVTGQYLTASGWVDSVLHVLEPLEGPRLALSQDGLAFGEVAVGDTSFASIRLTSIGGDTVTVEGAQSLNASFSCAAAPPFPWDLPPDSSRALPVRFHPTGEAPYSSSIVLAHNGVARGTDTLSVTGSGIVGLEGYVAVDGVETWSTWMGEDYYPPFVAQPSRIEVTIRNPGETPYSGTLRAVAIIGDLYGLGEGDRFWTQYARADCEVQSESFSALDNPTLSIEHLDPGESTVLVLDRLEHWPFLPAQDFVYKVPDFSEILTVYLIGDEQIIAQGGLGIEDGFRVTVSPETYLNCIGEILTVLHIPFPIGAFLESGVFGPQAASMILELDEDLNESPPDMEHAATGFLDLVILCCEFAQELGDDAYGRLPIIGLVTSAIDEIERNGCGALMGSFITDLRPFLENLVADISPEHQEGLGGLVEYIYSPGENLRIIVDVVSGQGARINTDASGATTRVPLHRDGEEIEPVSAFLQNQFVCAMPQDDHYAVTLLGQAADSLEISQIYVRPDSSMVKLTYKGLPTWDGSRAILLLEQGTVDFAFQIDIQNDGVVDLTWPPEQVLVLDGRPPAPVTDLSVTVADSTQTVSWTNPDDPDLKGVRVVFGAPHCPITPFSDPLAVNDTLGAPGEFRTCMLEGMDPRLSYCYRAWSYDASGNYADPDSGGWASGIPQAPAPAAVGDRMSLRIQPNPVTRAGTIAFDLPSPTNGCLEVWDLQGRQIRNLLLQGRLAAGAHRVTWDGMDDSGRSVASGLYWIALRSGRKTLTRKLMLIR